MCTSLIGLNTRSVFRMRTINLTIHGLHETNTRRASSPSCRSPVHALPQFCSALILLLSHLSLRHKFDLTSALNLRNLRSIAPFVMTLYITSISVQSLRSFPLIRERHGSKLASAAGDVAEITLLLNAISRLSVSSVIRHTLIYCMRLTLPQPNQPIQPQRLDNQLPTTSIQTSGVAVYC